MAKHIIRIEYLESSGVVNSISFDKSPINVSNFTPNTLANINTYNNEFLLNYSDLSGNSKLFPNSIGYYISYEKSDGEGNIDITLTVNTSNAKSISLVFSKEIYATSIVVNGVHHENIDNVFQTLLQGASNETTTIRFTKLNKANSPLIITNVNTGISIDYDERYIINFIRGSQLSTDNDLPKYETVGQYGSCSFIDAENVVIHLKSQGFLEKPSKIKLILDNQVVGVYGVDSWTYNTSNSVVEIDFYDPLNNFRDVALEKKKIVFDESRTLLQVFNDIKLLVENKNEVFEPLSSEISSWLSSIKTPFYMYDNTDLLELLNYFCEVSQCNIYKNQNGKLEVYLWR